MSIRWHCLPFSHFFFASAVDFGFKGEVKAPYDRSPHPGRPLASEAAVTEYE